MGWTQIIFWQICFVGKICKETFQTAALGGGETEKCSFIRKKQTFAAWEVQ